MQSFTKSLSPSSIVPKVTTVLVAIYTSYSLSVPSVKPNYLIIPHLKSTALQVKKRLENHIFNIVKFIKIGADLDRVGKSVGPPRQEEPYPE